MVLLYQSIDKLYENTVTAAKTSGVGQDGSGGGGFCEWISLPFLTSLDSSSAINIGTSCMNIICVCWLCVQYTVTYSYIIWHTLLLHCSYTGPGNTRSSPSSLLLPLSSNQTYNRIHNTHGDEDMGALYNTPMKPNRTNNNNNSTTGGSGQSKSIMLSDDELAANND